MCSNIVYKFSCPCCNARYVGCSSRHLKIRVFEYMGKSYRTRNYLNKLSFSAVRDHSHENDHPYSENDFEIVGRFGSEQDAFIGEKIIIQQINPELNNMS